MILTGEAEYSGKTSPTGGMILTGEAEYSGKILSHWWNDTDRKKLSIRGKSLPLVE
jgi:hypothetical protein